MSRRRRKVSYTEYREYEKRQFLEYLPRLRELEKDAFERKLPWRQCYTNLRNELEKATGTAH